MEKNKLINEVIWLQIDIEIAKKNGYINIVKRKTEELNRIKYLLEVL